MKLFAKKLFQPEGPIDAFFDGLAKTDHNLLIKLVENENMHPDVASFAVEALGNINGNAGLPLLKKRLHHEEGVVREGAIYGLKKMLSRRTVRGTLTEALKTEPHPALKDLIVDILNGEDDQDDPDEYDCI